MTDSGGYQEENGDTTNFYAFPRTPHIAGSSVVDNDESMPLNAILQQALDLGATRVVVQEKVDGKKTFFAYNFSFRTITTI